MSQHRFASCSSKTVLAKLTTNPKRREYLRLHFHILRYYPRADLPPAGLTVGMSMALIGNPSAAHKIVAWPVAWPLALIR